MWLTLFMEIGVVMNVLEYEFRHRKTETIVYKPAEFAVTLCPNCHGQKNVSRPPNVAGDIMEWQSSGTYQFPCPTCAAKGYLKV